MSLKNLLRSFRAVGCFQQHLLKIVPRAASLMLISKQDCFFFLFKLVFGQRAPVGHFRRNTHRSWIHSFLTHIHAIHLPGYIVKCSINLLGVDGQKTFGHFFSHFHDTMSVTQISSWGGSSGRMLRTPTTHCRRRRREIAWLSKCVRDELPK